MRRTAALVLSVLVGLTLATAAAPGAMAATDVSQAAADLRGGDPVYVAADAENALSASETADLTSQVLATGLPIYIAVLPASAAGGATSAETLVALKDAVGLGGVYAVIVGDEFRAASTRGSVTDLATQAFREQRSNGAYAVLSSFVTLTAEQFGGATSTADASGGGGGAVVFLLILLAGGAIVVVVLVRRSRRRQAAQLAAVRTTVDADITEYGERLAVMDLQDPDIDEATRADMQRALDSYDRAKIAVTHMRSPADAGNVTSALEDGRYALACVDARLDQRPLPERRPPCFIDPRHGPSVGDVLWAPPGLGARDVPMCAACRTTVETGGQPQALEVATAGGQRPYYQAGPEFGPYAQGYYSPFGGMMTAVVMGTMLSSMWHVPGVTGASGMDTAGLGGGGEGWGSLGGGDFGGGGGFGGGDFGGGDF